MQNTTTNVKALSKLQQAVLARKQARIQERDEQLASDGVLVDLLAQKEEQSEWYLALKTASDKLEESCKALGVKREWRVHAAYEFGSVGEIKRFLTLWVFAPDSVKSTLNIPISAYSSDDIDSWGRIPYCSLDGVIQNVQYTLVEEGMDGYHPDKIQFDSISFDYMPDVSVITQQVKELSLYLELPGEAPAVMSSTKWSEKAVKATASAIKKQKQLRDAEAQDQADKASGKATFSL